MGVRRWGGRFFVGREAEVAAIASAVDEAATRETSRVVWIEGEAGSGKTALVHAALASLPAPVTVMRAAADELATEVPLALADQLGPLAAREPLPAGLELLERFGADTSVGPTVVVVEDLHWADAASRHALLTTARRLDEDRIVLVVTSRPEEEVTDGWDRLRLDPIHCQRIVLGPLAVDEVAELARQSAVPLARPDAERLQRHTRGHPLHVRTLLAELEPEQLTAPEGELPAPRSLASTTVARLGELGSDALDLTAALAVINQRTPLDLVGRVAGVERPADSLEELLSAGLVTWSPAEPRTPIEFAHPLLRTAVYDDLSPAARHELHRRAAGVLDAGSVLPHRVAAADGVDDGLADDLRREARRDRVAGARSLAVRHLLWAAAVSSSPDAQEDLLLDAVDLLVQDRRTEAARALRDRVERCRDGPRRSFVLGRLAFVLGETGVAERWLLRLDADAIEQSADREIVAAGLGDLASLYAVQVRFDDAIDAAARALDLKPSDTATEHTAWQALSLGTAMRSGAVAGLERLREWLPFPAREVPAAAADVLITRGMLGFYAGRTTLAIDDLRAATRMARQGATTAQLPRAHLHLAQLLFTAGRWDEALLHAHLAESLVIGERRVWIEAQAASALACLLASRGQWDEADQRLRAAAEASEELGSVEASFATSIAHAYRARARDDPQGVVETLRPLVGQSGEDTVHMLTTLGWWVMFIGATIDIGDVAGAGEQIERLEAASQRRRLDLRARIMSLRARMAAACGEPDAAARSFDAALDLWQPDDPRLEEALLRQSYGRLLAAQARRRDAVDQLRAAHELLAAFGAEPYRRRVEADLAAAGIRAAPRMGGSPLDLTPRERDVVALVADGRSNREAAAELYVSEKSVEYHLRNVFGKLGISSRRELRGVL